MTWTVTAHTPAPIGHHGKAHQETFPSRTEAERYAAEARNEGATTTVTGQHQANPVTIGRAREWMNHIAGVWAKARTSPVDHDHKHGPEHCPICSAPTVEWRCGQPDCEICGP